MVKAKKYLGQHFLKDEQIAQRIVHSLQDVEHAVLEIGPGTGVLSKHLFSRVEQPFLLDIDSESIQFLLNKYPDQAERIIEADFLKSDLSFLPAEYSIIGNFPYNISSQIFFRILDERASPRPIRTCTCNKKLARKSCKRNARSLGWSGANCNSSAGAAY